MNCLLLHNGQTNYTETYLNNCETKPRNTQEERGPQVAYFVASGNIYFFKRLYTNIQLQLLRLQVSGSQELHAHSKESQYNFPQPERHISPSKNLFIFRVSRHSLCANALISITELRQQRQCLSTASVRCIVLTFFKTNSTQRYRSIFCRNAGTIYQITQCYNLITPLP